MLLDKVTNHISSLKLRLSQFKITFLKKRPLENWLTNPNSHCTWSMEKGNKSSFYICASSRCSK